MICVSLADMDFKECLLLAENEPFVEFRFDQLDFTPEQVSTVVKTAKKCIATYRPDSGDPDRRILTLLSAVKAGANYIDIELETDSRLRRELMEEARSMGREVIISYHNFSHTPGINTLKEIYNSCRALGADVVKIACQVKKTVDNRALMSLYGEEGRMVIIGMGKEGLITRVAAPFMGAEFTFASPVKGKETAPGQISRDELASLINQVKHPFLREQYKK